MLCSVASAIALLLTVHAGAEAREASARAVFQEPSMPGTISYLGVFIGDVNEERARKLRLADIRGVVVGKVEQGSPAEKFGIRENDVILAFNGRPVQDSSQFYRVMMDTPPGTRVVLEISRLGEMLKVAVDLGRRRSEAMIRRQRLFSESDAMLVAAEDKRREAEALMQKGDEKGAQKILEEEKMFRQQAAISRAYIEDQIRQGAIVDPVKVQNQTNSLIALRYNLGLTVISLNEQLSAYFNLPAGGVLISEVRPGSAADRSGLKAGDCVVAVNGEKVDSPAGMFQTIDKAAARPNKGPLELQLTLVRERAEQRISVSVPD